MTKVGLLTLYGRNYGSALQCYATKKTVEKLGFECVLLRRSYTGADKYAFYASEFLRAGLYSFVYRGFLKNYIAMRRAGKFSIASVSEKSAFALDLFAKATLQPHQYSYRDLSTLAGSGEYRAFITGSDQVWSGSRPADRTMFLRFAPQKKRVAYAPSFGCESVMRFNRRSFGKYIKEIPALSTREESGRENIKALTGRDCVCLPDPTYLLTAEEWRGFSTVPGQCDEAQRGGYILAHFLDEPNAAAMETLKAYAQKTGLRVLCFAYPHQAILSLDCCTMADGAPQDYLRLIDNAAAVFTDSFHTSSFSVLFSSSFYVFDRQYRHGASQASRIRQLLTGYNYTDRFIKAPTAADALPREMHDCTALIAAQRQKGLDYLRSALGAAPEEEKGVNGLKADRDCCGCGACAAACPRDAISLMSNAAGYRVPVTDAGKCIHCGRCEMVCRAEIHPAAGEVQGCACYNTDAALCAASASGGVFSALAGCIIERGGAVFGAALSTDGGTISVRHEMACTENELYRILGSKYVESDCIQAYRQVKSALAEGKEVLFSGTSCQIDGLYRFLGTAEYDKLYTLDLVCHGVPGAGLFADYIAMIEKHTGAAATDFSFRRKRGGATEYTETVRLRGKGGDERTVCIPWESSPYYRMFLAMESYRDACYGCKFASLHKPADITAGDFFELKRDYPQISARLGAENGVSCMLVRSDKGRRLLEAARGRLNMETLSADMIQFSHAQLCAPPVCTGMRKKLFKLYAAYGMEGVARHYRVRSALLWLPKHILKRH